MPNGEKKGITVRIDADLHAEVSQYLRDHSMTMAEFVSLALDDELHPKNQMKETLWQTQEPSPCRCRRICSSGSRTTCSATT